MTTAPRRRAGPAGPKAGPLTRVWARSLAVLGLAAVGLAASGPAALAQTANPHTPQAGLVTLNAAGSSWAAVAIDYWDTNMQAKGLTVNYTPSGSAAGRVSFIQEQEDFAGSDPPFDNGGDLLAGTGAEIPHNTYSYVPDTAGGTGFMYHLVVAGKLVSNLRLSDSTLLGIFTGTITNWDNPAITKDYGAQLPSLPITPVVRSDASGASYFLSRWFAHQYPSQWNAFCKAHLSSGAHVPASGCPQTEQYPVFGTAKAENGSTDVANYIVATDGAIGYDEYAYALQDHYPVAAIQNPGGYYVLPNAFNVAIALRKAVIFNNPSDPATYLQQNLDPVYTYTDHRSYPLSSYSYLIVPRAPRPPSIFNSPAGKGKSLSAYINYFLCSGQQNLDSLGYSSLPENLVKGGLAQVARIPGGSAASSSQASLNKCGNPTMRNGQDVLLTQAPQPQWCQKAGTPLKDIVSISETGWTCLGGQPPKTGIPGGPSASASPGAGTPGAGASPGASTTAGPAGTVAGAAGNVTPTVVNLAADQRGGPLFGLITALGVLAAVAAPPGFAMWVRRRRGPHG